MLPDENQFDEDVLWELRSHYLPEGLDGSERYLRSHNCDRIPHAHTCAVARWNHLDGRRLKYSTVWSLGTGVKLFRFLVDRKYIIPYRQTYSEEQCLQYLLQHIRRTMEVRAESVRCSQFFVFDVVFHAMYVLADSQTRGICPMFCGDGTFYIVNYHLHPG